MDMDDYEDNYDLRPEVQASLPRAQEVVHLFVTTKAELQPPHSDVPTVGSWFNLLRFNNKGEFIAAAKEYARTKFNETEPTLIFSGIDTHVNVDDLFDSETCEPSADFWTLFTLSHNEFTVLHNYVTCYPILGDGVVKAMETARSLFVGYFYTSKQYVTYKLREAGATEESINLLGDRCDWDLLESDLLAQNNTFAVRRFFFQNPPIQ